MLNLSSCQKKPINKNKTNRENFFFNRYLKEKKLLRVWESQLKLKFLTNSFSDAMLN